MSTNENVPSDTPMVNPNANEEIFRLSARHNKKVFEDQRAQCWRARDLHLGCLDKYNDDHSKCTRSYDMMFRDCPKAWAAYFLEQRKATLSMISTEKSRTGRQ